MACDARCLGYLVGAYSIIPTIVMCAASMGALFMCGVMYAGTGTRRHHVLINCGFVAAFVCTVTWFAGTVCLFVGVAQNNPDLLMTWIVIFAGLTAVWMAGTLAMSFYYTVARVRHFASEVLCLVSVDELPEVADNGSPWPSARHYPVHKH
ncbi:hypothetical protein BV898_17829 [Hypsibius exemplaris]|uniref:Uncharacterized protein n=1 Tax=Hypsibius exemplaris TaxID=2072580 RepID=A0A9X6NHZ0_HYPEX|nr:hypothetical protein BV898_17829 [Hypsibius exemplaris]